MRADDVSVIGGEESIVWLDSKAIYLPYVRESVYGMASSRSRGLGLHWKNVVAYATLSREAKSTIPGRFVRRYWWLAKHDPYRFGGGPFEAVDPQSIAPQKLSARMTEDQWERTGKYEKFRTPEHAPGCAHGAVI